ncbi:MAG: ATP-binding protein, partial [Chloroflexota bacterium]|nr:ATP-binding protein [Chloroflexota bacterium]
ELVRSTRLIRNLLEFARQSPPALREVDVNEVINATGIPLKSKPEKAELNDAAGDSGGEAFDLGYSAKLQHIEVVTELDPDLPRLMADFDQLQQVFTNLILNAIQAMPRGGRLTIRTARNGGWVRIEVKDTGSGISRENMPRLFTPFFTTRPEVKGVGLGLAVAYGIIQRHQGRIEVQSEAGKGSTFSVYLPLDNLSTNKRQTLPNPE